LQRGYRWFQLFFILQLVGVLHVEEERKLDLHVELELLGDLVVVLIWVAVVVAFL
jgi:hypothetical protein